MIINEHDYSHLLRRSAEELDISPTMYQRAVERYSAVGRWICRYPHEGCQGEPQVYPQGSFRLGTVVRPLRDGKEEAEYDIDLVCELQRDKAKTSPAWLKAGVGNCLKAHDTYKGMLGREGRRCWTINYAESDGVGFHMDVLPSVPEASASIGHGAVAITNKDDTGIYSWCSSNPRGYAKWFEGRNAVAAAQVSLSQKRAIFEAHREIFEKVDDVPNLLLRTPLQRVIQILKRHRDTRFAGRSDEGDKPISMVITTIAALMYQNEPDVLSTLKNIVSRIEAHASLIGRDISLSEQHRHGFTLLKNPQGGWYLPNPVNPNENFADRWHENGHRKAKAFFQWAVWVKQDLIEIMNTSSLATLNEGLRKSLGERIVSNASAGLFPAASFSMPNRAPKQVEITNPSKPWRKYG